MPNLDGRRRSRCFANPDFSNRRRNSGLENDHRRHLKGVNAVRKAMEAAPCPIAISDDADEILGRPAFPFIKQPVDLDLVVLSVFELGFGAQAARTDVALGASAEVSLRDIYARAVSLGFELSPAEVGPVLRLQYLDQPHGEFLEIAMNPVAKYTGELIRLSVARAGTGSFCLGVTVTGRTVLVAVRFVFVRSGPLRVNGGGLAKR